MIPNTVSLILNKALELVRSDLNHELRPKHRDHIYASWSEPTFDTQRLQANLAIITAQRVLPIWQKRMPEDKTPDYAINLARMILDGTIDHKVASQEANGKIWNHFGNRIESRKISRRAIYAYSAAIEALFIVLGRKPFEYLDIDEYNTNGDIPPGEGDVASSAIIAYVEILSEIDANLKKNLEFWEWWLTEAIPQAWELAQQSSSS